MARTCEKFWIWGALAFDVRTIVIFLKEAEQLPAPCIACSTLAPHVCMRAANTAANIATTRLNTEISSKDDLRGKAVATWEDLVPMLQSEGILAAGLPWCVNSMLGCQAFP